MLFTPALSRLARLSLIILSIAATGGFAHAATTPANEGGRITLYGKKGDVTDPENDSNSNCTISVPPAGSSRTVDVLLSNPASECYGLRVVSIAMDNMPPATQVLLTDDYLCDTTLGDSFNVERDPSTNKNFWIKLKTGANGATLVEESISALNFKGFATNSSSSGKVSEEVKVEDFAVSGGAERMTYTLSCVRITTSTNKTTKIGTYYNIPATAWILAGKEHESVRWQCPEGQFITARKHKGDEKDNTEYKCTSIEGVKAVPSEWSNMLRECGVRLDAEWSDSKNRYKTCNEKETITNDWSNTDYYYFTCPVDQVMVGRGHGYSNSSDWPEDDTGGDNGDENGRTDYRCATLYQGEPSDSTRITVLPGTWSTPNTESGKENKDENYPEHDGVFECPINQVMVGRAHRGDENNLTRYLCARLRSPAIN